MNTFEDIIDFLVDCDISVNGLRHGDVESHLFEEKLPELYERAKEEAKNSWTRHDWIFQQVVGPYSIVEERGGEGQGEDARFVVHFEKPDIYIAWDGWYQSYDGFNYDGPKSGKEVKPVEKMVTFYEWLLDVFF